VAVPFPLRVARRDFGEGCSAAPSGISSPSAAVAVALACAGDSTCTLRLRVGFGGLHVGGRGTGLGGTRFESLGLGGTRFESLGQRPSELRRGRLRHLERHGRTAGGLDLAPRLRREGVGDGQDRMIELAAAEDLQRPVEPPDETRGEEQLRIHGGRRPTRARLEAPVRERGLDAPDVHHGVRHPETVLEAAQLGHAHVDGRLAAFEPGRLRAPRA